MNKEASYGIKVIGADAPTITVTPDMPEYKHMVSLKEFSEKSGISIDDIGRLIEIEKDIKRGFGKDRKLERVLFKVIDYRTAILQRGYFCTEVENFLYPPKALNIKKKITKIKNKKEI